MSQHVSHTVRIQLQPLHAHHMYSIFQLGREVHIGLSALHAAANAQPVIMLAWTVGSDRHH